MYCRPFSYILFFSANGYKLHLLEVIITSSEML